MKRTYSVVCEYVLTMSPSPIKDPLHLYYTFLIPASSKVFIRTRAAAAASIILNISTAPLPSPSLISRSRQGFNPSLSSTRPPPFSALKWEGNTYSATRDQPYGSQRCHRGNKPVRHNRYPTVGRSEENARHACYIKPSHLAKRIHRVLGSGLFISRALSTILF